jgi:glycosyltransferase involved in cell wall biosynthesis
MLVTRLYKNARLVLFPSHYEGFGLPFMHSLAHRKPVIARRLPVFDEIRSRVQESANIYLCDTTDEMVRLAVTDLHWTQENGSCPANEFGWGSTADALERGLSEARRRFAYPKLLERLQCAADVSVTEARDATADADALRDEVKQLRAQLAALYASTSWRIAKPIRAVAKLLPRKHR